jgi:hypothetical protein
MDAFDAKVIRFVLFRLCLGSLVCLHNNPSLLKWDDYRNTDGCACVLDLLQRGAPS